MLKCHIDIGKSASDLNYIGQTYYFHVDVGSTVS